LLLILYGSHKIFVSPIHGGRGRDEAALQESRCSCGVSLVNEARSKDDFEELLAAEISVFVHRQSVSVFANGSLQVVEGDTLQILLPNHSSEAILGGRVFFAMERFEGLPLRVEVGVKRKRKTDGQEGQQNRSFQHHFDSMCCYENGSKIQ